MKYIILSNVLHGKGLQDLRRTAATGTVAAIFSGECNLGRTNPSAPLCRDPPCIERIPTRGYRTVEKRTTYYNVRCNKVSCKRKG